ncbi:hypothetical protein MIR68_010632 [Amoeboaphelidium protococcarum]|nr:hypothetical protein MIR68_010632 [Amoeboaphelidium protococcarum]
MDDAISSDQQSAYAARKLEFEEFVQGPRCTIETRVDTVDGYAPGSLKFIKRPGASKLTHTLFHPSIYRSGQSFGYGSDGLDGLASFLDVGENWKAAAAYCEADNRVGSVRKLQPRYWFLKHHLSGYAPQQDRVNDSGVQGLHALQIPNAFAATVTKEKL